MSTHTVRDDDYAFVGTTDRGSTWRVTRRCYLCGRAVGHRSGVPSLQKHLIEDHEPDDFGLSPLGERRPPKGTPGFHLDLHEPAEPVGGHGD